MQERHTMGSSSAEVEVVLSHTTQREQIRDLLEIALGVILPHDPGKNPAGLPHEHCNLAICYFPLRLAAMAMTAGGDTHEGYQREYHAFIEAIQQDPRYGDKVQVEGEQPRSLHLFVENLDRLCALKDQTMQNMIFSTTTPAEFLHEKGPTTQQVTIAQDYVHVLTAPLYQALHQIFEPLLSTADPTELERKLEQSFTGEQISAVVEGFEQIGKIAEKLEKDIVAKRAEEKEEGKGEKKSEAAAQPEAKAASQPPSVHRRTIPTPLSFEQIQRIEDMAALTPTTPIERFAHSFGFNSPATLPHARTMSDLSSWAAAFGDLSPSPPAVNNGRCKRAVSLGEILDGRGNPIALLAAPRPSDLMQDEAGAAEGIQPFSLHTARRPRTPTSLPIQGFAQRLTEEREESTTASTAPSSPGVYFY